MQRNVMAQYGITFGQVVVAIAVGGFAEKRTDAGVQQMLLDTCCGIQDDVFWSADVRIPSFRNRQPNKSGNTRRGYVTTLQSKLTRHDRPSHRPVDEARNPEAGQRTAERNVNVVEERLLALAFAIEQFQNGFHGVGRRQEEQKYGRDDENAGDVLICCCCGWKRVTDS